jgi:hypothetical protein
VHSFGATEAMSLLVLRSDGGIDLCGQRLPEALGLVTQYAARLEACIFRRLQEKHRNIDVADSPPESPLKLRIVLPAQCPGRYGNRDLVPNVAFGCQQRFDAAKRAACDDEPREIQATERTTEIRISAAVPILIRIV